MEGLLGEEGGERGNGVKRDEEPGTTLGLLAFTPKRKRVKFKSGGNQQTLISWPPLSRPGIDGPSQFSQACCYF